MKWPLFFIFIFFLDSPTQVTRPWNFTRDGSKRTLWRKEVPFWGPHDGRHFGVQIPQKPSKMAFYKHVRASAYGLKTNDVIKDWRRWLRYVAACCRGQAVYTIYSIWEITAAMYFQVILQNWCTLTYDYVQRYSNKTANINVQNRPQFIRQLTASLHIKNSKYWKKMILLSSTLALKQRHAA